MLEDELVLVINEVLELDDQVVVEIALLELDQVHLIIELLEQLILEVEDELDLVEVEIDEDEETELLLFLTLQDH